MLTNVYIPPAILNSLSGTPLITKFNSRKIKYYLISFLVCEICVGSTNTFKTHVLWEMWLLILSCGCIPRRLMYMFNSTVKLL